MRSTLAALLLLALPSLLCAVLPGDPIAAVLKEKGEPTNIMVMRNVKILLYPDVEIRAEDDVVVTVTPRTAPPAAKAGANQPRPPAKPRPR